MRITQLLTGIVFAVLLSAGSGFGGSFQICAEAYTGASTRRFLLCRPSAEQGYAVAQFALGFMYVRGLGVVQDYAEALKWYRKAADQG